MTIFRRAPACLVASGVFFLGLFYAAGTVTYAAPINNELMLVNAQTGKCLTIAGGVSTANNVESVQFDCDSDPSRRWMLREMSGGNIYQIKNVQQRSVAHLEDQRRDRQRRQPNQERADQQMPDDCRGREYRQQRPRPAVSLRRRSVTPLDDQAEAVARANRRISWPLRLPANH